jgi:hypothetical protein
MKLCDKRLKCKYMYITLYISSQIHINTTGATIEAGTTHSSEHLSLPPVFSGIRVTRSLVLCVCFVDRCLSFLF